MIFRQFGQRHTSFRPDQPFYLARRSSGLPTDRAQLEEAPRLLLPFLPGSPRSFHRLSMDAALLDDSIDIYNSSTGVRHIDGLTR